MGCRKPFRYVINGFVAYPPYCIEGYLYRYAPNDVATVSIKGVCVAAIDTPLDRPVFTFIRRLVYRVGSPPPGNSSAETNTQACYVHRESFYWLRATQEACPQDKLA